MAPFDGHLASTRVYFSFLKTIFVSNTVMSNAYKCLLTTVLVTRIVWIMNSRLVWNLLERQSSGELDHTPEVRLGWCRPKESFAQLPIDLGISPFWRNRGLPSQSDGGQWGREIPRHREVLRVDAPSGCVRAAVMHGPGEHRSQGIECAWCPLEFRNKVTPSQRQGTGSGGEPGTDLGLCINWEGLWPCLG